MSMGKENFELKCSLDQIKAELAAGQKAHREALAALQEEFRREFEKGRRESDEALARVAATIQEVFGHRSRN